jgi:hypothetical protein
MTQVIVFVVAHLCYMPLVFENGYATTKKLACSVFGKERVYNSCAMCISHSISHGTTQPCVAQYTAVTDSFFTNCRTYNSSVAGYPFSKSGA